MLKINLLNFRPCIGHLGISETAGLFVFFEKVLFWTHSHTGGLIKAASVHQQTPITHLNLYTGKEVSILLKDTTRVFTNPSGIQTANPLLIGQPLINDL